MRPPAADQRTSMRDNSPNLSPAARLYQHFLLLTRNDERESWLRLCYVRRSSVAFTSSQLVVRNMRTMKQIQH